MKNMKPRNLKKKNSHIWSHNFHCKLHNLQSVIILLECSKLVPTYKFHFKEYDKNNHIYISVMPHKTWKLTFWKIFLNNHLAASSKLNYFRFMQHQNKYLILHHTFWTENHTELLVCFNLLECMWSKKPDLIYMNCSAASCIFYNVSCDT